MTKHTLVKLAVGTAIALGLAIWVSNMRGPTQGLPQVGEPLVKGLRETINEVTRLRVVEAADKPAVTLQRDERGWTVAERDGYPADIAKVRETLIKFAEATLIEAKTDNPERYAALGVEDVSKPEAKGMRVEFDGKTKARIIVGHYSPQGNGSFVRRNDEAQSWLAKGNLIIDRQASNWLDKDLVDIPSDRVMRVEIRRGDSSFVVSKSSPEQVNYVVENLPKGRELRSEYEANGIGSVLAGLRCDDVAKAESVVADPDSQVVATFHTFDGLIVEIAGFSSSGKHYATLKASVDQQRVELAAKAEQQKAEAEYRRQTESAEATKTEAAAESASKSVSEAAAKPEAPLAVTDPAAFIAERRKAIEEQAAALNRRVQGWSYVLPAYKFANIDKRLEDLLKPKA